jgi:hypothetical protein
VNSIKKIIEEYGCPYTVEIVNRAIQGANLSMTLSQGCLHCNLCPNGFGINIVVGGSPLTNEQYFDATPSEFTTLSGPQDPILNNFPDSPTSFGMGSVVEMHGIGGARLDPRMLFTKSLTPEAVDHTSSLSSVEMIHSGPPSMFSLAPYP